MYIRHPWESGQDNSPIWDRILKRIKLKQKDIPEYRRVDTTLVASGERPSDAEYDRYAYLFKIAYNHEYEEARIRKACPFLVKDVLFNTIAVRANRDLAALAEVVGEDPIPFLEWANLTSDHLNNFGATRVPSILITT